LDVRVPPEGLWKLLTNIGKVDWNTDEFEPGVADNGPKLEIMGVLIAG
jgi:hypothetical protein